MIILLLNAGSSSLKASLMDSADGKEIAHALADWAGSTTHYEDSAPDGKKTSEDVGWKGHAAAVRHFIDSLKSSTAVLPAAVGHRVVHGGPFTSSVRITPEIRARIDALADLAPLHNPPSLDTLAAAQSELPDVPHVAVFDTAFHATLAPEAYTYAIPATWTQQWGIRRYGFHGLSHAYCAKRAEQMLLDANKGAKKVAFSSPFAPRLVICHLGHGCSASAVAGGKCVDTSMGFTPLDGLMMATRCGAIDPSIVLHVQQHHGLTAAQVESALNRDSGLLGVSGVSADMREVLAAAGKGSVQARLALDIYARRVRQTIGAFTATLGGVDALVFTAGVGEHSAEMRAAMCTGLDCLGLVLDAEANAHCRPDADVATPSSKARIFVIATREDLTMLHEVCQVLGVEPFTG